MKQLLFGLFIGLIIVLALLISIKVEHYRDGDSIFLEQEKQPTLSVVFWILVKEMRHLLLFQMTHKC